MHARVLLVLTVVVVVLTGCASGPTEPPSAGTTPPQAETQTATPTPTPTAPVEDPNDPSTWIIDGDGIGPVSIGTPVSDLPALLPGFSDATQVEHCPWVAVFSRDGYPDLVMPLSPDLSTVAAMSVVGYSQSEGLADTSPRTREGIGLGSTQADVLAAYPDAPEDYLYAWPYYPVPAGSRWIVVSTQGEDALAVSTISIEDVPMPRKEFCG